MLTFGLAVPRLLSGAGRGNDGLSLRGNLTA